MLDAHPPAPNYEREQVVFGDEEWFPGREGAFGSCVPASVSFLAGYKALDAPFAERRLRPTQGSRLPPVPVRAGSQRRRTNVKRVNCFRESP